MMIRILRALTRYITAFYNLGFGYTFNTYINGKNLILVRSDLDWLPRSIELY